ncbi:MAG: carboxylating nicotinate-nucleotide diphosphorylase [Geodermatophilaceae bacterium]|nr:carboxylating nicotinate-nucleotide diphosphorylase [Geodermatophilaceae bacterium]
MRRSTVDSLVAAGLDPAWVDDVVRRALAEDLGDRGDVTSQATIPAGQTGTADVIARAPGVVAGLPVAVAVLDTVVDDAQVDQRRTDGDRVSPHDILLTVTGSTQRLLTAERTMLNLLCRISGVATATRAWADALAGSGTTVLDTRKTTPGLRALEKYAVRCGGGTNKRLGLYDVAMIKDNHIVAAGGVAAAYDAVRRTYPDIVIQVEVSTVDMAVNAVRAGATFLLCDNMPPDQLRAVVVAVGQTVELEATGGLTLARAREYAETGVHYLSVGALTHSAPIVDIAMDLRGR